MTDPHSTAGHLGDLLATIVGGIGALGTIAQIINPILTMILTLLTIIWFSLRIANWRRTGNPPAE